jgi:hypothetical protein
MPEPTGGPVDPDRVEFEYTPSQGGGVHKLQRANDASSCGADGGWYYDDNDQPTKLVLCPSTCAMVQADPEPQLDILIACAPVHR